MSQTYPELVAMLREAGLKPVVLNVFLQGVCNTWLFVGAPGDDVYAAAMRTGVLYLQNIELHWERCHRLVDDYAMAQAVLRETEDGWMGIEDVPIQLVEGEPHGRS